MATTAATPDDQELLDAVRYAQAADQGYLAAEELRRKARERVVELLRMRGESEVAVEDGTEGYKVRVITAERVAIDDDVLIEVLGKRAYNRLTERRASKDKVLAAIRDGLLDPAQLAAAVTVKSTAAWPRIDRYVPEQEDV